ncbi:hypothetical protein CSA37_08840 [Candidatus Fermentibacteria bacterium]|nr:MAG: hypothetical protein CSA37_08840 [Candidatus Fermentibacteria bacterium]
MNSANNSFKKPLRKFGFTMFGAFAVLASIMYLREKSFWWVSGGLSVFFLFPALLVPGILAPVEKAWMALAGVMGFVMTSVLLTLVFFIGILPTGLVMRLTGRDPLKKKPEKSVDSYWISVAEDGPCSRPDKPY